MKNVFEQIKEIGIVPVIKISDTSKAVPLAKALVQGGIPCAEITFRTKEAAEAIRLISSQVPEILLGAGTVRSISQADEAMAAGAQFIVSAGLNAEVVKHCISKGIPIAPGCATPSEMERATELGLKTVKFFPAEQAGGLAYIKAVSAPYSELNFMPTGGIDLSKLNSYLSFEKIVACGGSWMVPPALIEAGEFDKIAALCKDSVQKMLGFKLVHLGINAESEQEGLAAAKLFEHLFGFEIVDTEKAWFAGTGFEIMKNGGRGRMGHIAIGTNSVLRAEAYLSRLGVQFDQESAMINAMGQKLIYLKKDIAGFAVHLLENLQA